MFESRTRDARPLAEWWCCAGHNGSWRISELGVREMQAAEAIWEPKRGGQKVQCGRLVRRVLATRLCEGFRHRLEGVVGCALQREGKATRSLTRKSMRLAMRKTMRKTMRNTTGRTTGKTTGKSMEKPTGNTPGRTMRKTMRKLKSKQESSSESHSHSLGWKRARGYRVRSQLYPGFSLLYF